MKYLFFLLFLGCTLSSKAAPGSDDKIVTTYYGKKAVQSTINPCKGSTIRECGKVEVSNDRVTENSTLVTTTLKDPNETVIATDIQLLDIPVEDVEKAILEDLNLKSNADVKIIKK